jgi:hypothetical protein
LQQIQATLTLPGATAPGFFVDDPSSAVTQPYD